MWLIKSSIDHIMNYLLEIYKKNIEVNDVKLNFYKLGFKPYLWETSVLYFFKPSPISNLNRLNIQLQLPSDRLPLSIIHLHFPSSLANFSHLINKRAHDVVENLFTSLVLREIRIWFFHCLHDAFFLRCFWLFNNLITDRLQRIVSSLAIDPLRLGISIQDFNERHRLCRKMKKQTWPEIIELFRFAGFSQLKRHFECWSDLELPVYRTWTMFVACLKRFREDYSNHAKFWLMKNIHI